MNEKAKQLGSEFITGVFHDIPEGINQGLSKREYFAGLAMQASLSSPELMEFITSGSDVPMDAIARVSIKAADALLAELSKEE